MLQKLENNEKLFAGEFASVRGIDFVRFTIGKDRRVMFNGDHDRFSSTFMADLTQAFRSCGFEPKNVKLEKTGDWTFNVRDARSVDRNDNPDCRFTIAPNGEVVFEDTHYYLTNSFVSGLILAYRQRGFQV
jgi:hypothetical protein